MDERRAIKTLPRVQRAGRLSRLPAWSPRPGQSTPSSSPLPRLGLVHRRCNPGWCVGAGSPYSVARHRDLARAMSILEAALRGGTVAVLLLLAAQVPRRRVGAGLVAALVAALALHIAAPCQAAEVVARVSYADHSDRIPPFAEKTATTGRLEVRLSTEGTVQHSEARASGGTRGGTRREGSAVLKLGAQQNRSWRVAGPDQLINIADYTSFQR